MPPARSGTLRLVPYTDMIYEFDKPLDFPLPEGYHFVAPGKCIIEKIQGMLLEGLQP